MNRICIRGPIWRGVPVVKLVLAVGVFALSASCGDDGGGGGGYSYTPPSVGSAALQCRNLTEDVCRMWVDCGELSGGEYTDCTVVLDAELDCDLARDTSFGYQSCVRDLDTGCYEMGGGLPTSCVGVILF